MEVSRTRALRGPNMWSRHTAIEAVVHCSETERAPDDGGSAPEGPAPDDKG